MTPAQSTTQRCCHPALVASAPMVSWLKGVLKGVLS
jgi:hypothetical protein